MRFLSLWISIVECLHKCDTGKPEIIMFELTSVICFCVSGHINKYVSHIHNVTLIPSIPCSNTVVLCISCPSLSSFTFCVKSIVTTGTSPIGTSTIFLTTESSLVQSTCTIVWSTQWVEAKSLRSSTFELTSTSTFT